MSLYATLGDIDIDVLSGPTSLDMRLSATYAEHTLIGRKSALHFTGFSPDELNYTIRLHATWCDPALEIQKLRDAKRAAEALALVFATGEYWGNFVIKELTTVTTLTNAQGAMIALEASLSLAEYIGDPVEPNPPGVLSASVSIDTTTAQPPTPETPTGLLGALNKAFEVAGQVGEAASKVNGIVSAAQSGDLLGAVSQAGAYAPQVSEMAAQLPVEEFQELEGAAAVANDAGKVAQQLSHTRGFLNQASTQLQTGSTISGLSSASGSMQSALQSVGPATPALNRLDAKMNVGSRLLGLAE